MARVSRRDADRTINAAAAGENWQGPSQRPRRACAGFRGGGRRPRRVKRWIKRLPAGDFRLCEYGADAARFCCISSTWDGLLIQAEPRTSGAIFTAHWGSEIWGAPEAAVLEPRVAHAAVHEPLERGPGLGPPPRGRALPYRHLGGFFYRLARAAAPDSSAPTTAFWRPVFQSRGVLRRVLLLLYGSLFGFEDSSR